MTHVGISQDRQVTGKVTDSDNAALPGVSILVKGTTRGTTTTAEGTFKISAKEGSTLVFNSLGYEKKEIKVGNQSVLNVSLVSSSSELDEVTVTTAFGLDKSKRSLGYATQTVNGDEIAESGRENIFNALQSRVAGATINATSGAPGASSALVLRGFNSLSGNNSPLIVIDGLPINNSTLNQGQLASGGSNRDNDFSNRLSDLNPNDIESLTVLKGPEATSLYGIDAGSGAIIIKTKRGQAGKPKISYSNSFRIDQTYLFPETSQSIYGTGTTGSSTQTRLMFGPKLPEGTPIYDNIRNFFKDALTSMHNFSVNGGKDNLTYRASLGSTNQNGTVPNTIFDRYNARLTLNYSAFKNKLNMSVTGAYTYSYNQKALRGTNGYLQGLLYWPVTDDASDYINADGSRRRFFDSENFAEIDNPYWSVNKNQSADKTYRRNYNFSATYKPLSWLDVITRLSYDGFNTDGYTFYHPSSNDFFSVGGHLEEYTQQYRGLSGVFIVGANRKITPKINMDLRVGTAVDDYRTETFSKRGQRLTRQVVGSTAFIPEFRTTDPATYLDSRSLGRDTLTLRRLQGVFGEYVFSYDKWLTLTLTGRNDWTSTLPAESRSFFYPAASLAFVFSDLLPKSKVLTFGKLRGSLAETAKDILPYNSQSVYAKQLTSGLGYGYGFTNNNPGILPERQQTFEVGAELKFFEDRLSIDAAYYNTKNVGQIVRLVRLSYGSGFILATLNVADTRNEGVELIVTAKPIKAKNFLWNTTFNFAKTSNEVLNLPANIPEYYNSDTFLSAFRNGLVPGGTTTTITGQDYLRNSKGQILIDPGTGNPLVNPNYVKIGDRNPDFTLGINNNFTIHKNFNVSFLLDIKKGGDVMNGTAYARTLQGQTAITLDREKSQIVPGVLNDGLQETDNPTINTIQIYPQYSTYYQDGRLYASNFMERNVNWLRLRQLSFGYNLPKSWVQKIGFEAANVFINGTDLFILTNYSGADPSVNGNTASTQGTGGYGIDWFTTSTPRGFAVGIKADFKVK
ncbi:MAG: SusC/RagA family TonB-linked outer membrane protein [Arcicella sp.]|jgi:TonB-linked SusC/RagA family outer membrane protein|nr:SusC/RagA family TonB-linked outer membrane protein [Arcicella sp.]